MKIINSEASSFPSAIPAPGLPRPANDGSPRIGGTYPNELAAYREALDDVAIVAITDRAGSIVDVNRMFCDISGYGRDELVGVNHRLLNSGHHPRQFFQAMWRQISAGLVWRGEICNRAKNGQLYWVDTTIAPLRHADGDLAGYLSIRFDISSRKAAEAELMEQLRKVEATESLLSDIVETIPNALVVHDVRGDLVFCNSAYRRLYQPVATEHALPGLTSKPYIQQLGSDRWVQVHDRRSRSGNLVSVRTDISALKRAQLQVKQQAESDPLTGIGNRSLVMRRLANLAKSRRSSDAAAMLMLIDLDEFKLVNDRFGHDGGDVLLQELAERLRSSVRRTDTVARLGGDEFAILMRDIDRSVAESVAQKVLDKIRRPLRIGQRTVTPSASIGVALFPDDARTPVDLIKNADLALYQAKLNGRRRYSLYDSSIARQRRRRAALTDRLRDAIDARQIGVAFQPKACVLSRRHIGFEALVRWQVGGKPVDPPELIAIAEEAGLINDLGDLVIDKSLATLAAFKREQLSPGSMAFNVVAAQLQAPDFAERLYALIERHALKPHDIEIEVTENVILDRSAGDFSKVLCALRKSGVSISLDDFGTGYASLTHLKQFPINFLKIDRSFVSGIPDDKGDEIIVRTIISLAHSLGLRAIAEGVETLDQYTQLSNFGCDFVQGFLLARPMDEQEARKYLISANGPDALARFWGRTWEKGPAVPSSE